MTRHRGARRSAATRPAQLTHFLCLPLTTAASRPQLEATTDVFRKDIAAEISAKAVRPVGTLHLTLGVMSVNASQLSSAITALQGIDLQALLSSADSQSSEQSLALHVLLQGLESMHEPGNTSILYIEPQDPTGRLPDFCLALQAVFREQELLVPDERPLRLHATVINTIYAKGSIPRPAGSKQLGVDAGGTASSMLDGSTGHGPKAKGSIKFDARSILERYKDYVWAEDILIDRVAICEMGAKKEYDDEGRLVDEHYIEVTQIMLPR